MNQILLWVAALLSTVYGALTAFAGLGQFKENRIQAWAAWGMTLCGLAVIVGAILMIVHSGMALWILAAGLVGIHIFALNNGFKMFGRINPSHHLSRLAVTIILVVLTYTVLR